MIIAVDFDGTCVRHEYPMVGKDIGAVPHLKKLVDLGHKIVLNTMRSGSQLEDAVQWFKYNEIPLYGVNETPGQKSWTSSPKVFAKKYIDDNAIGCPTIKDAEGFTYVNWEEVMKLI